MKTMTTFGTNLEFLNGKEILILDFEVRSGTLLHKGYPAYLNDPKFEPLILTYLHLKGPSTEIQAITDYESIKIFCNDLKKFAKKNIIVAHNVEFDFAVFQKLTGVPDSYFLNWVDTMTMSCYGGGPPGLADASLFWDVGLKLYGKTLIKVLCEPFTKKTPKVVAGVTSKDHVQKNGFVEHPDLFKNFLSYAKRDTYCTAELFKKLIKEGVVREYLDSKQRANAYINFKRNMRGVNFDLGLTKNLLSKTDRALEAFSVASKRLTGIADFNLNSSHQFVDFFKKYKIKSSEKNYLFKFKSETPELTEKEKKLIDLRVSRPTGVLKKLNLIVENNDNNIIRNTIIHFESFTGRYKSYGVQMLNFPRKKEFEKGLIEDNDKFIKQHKENSAKVILGSMRKTIIPHKGCIFYGGDFSSIDFRLLLGASGETKSLKKVYEGWDVYKYIGGKIHNKSVKDVTKDERYVAKRIVLARGYGIGLKGTLNTLAKDDIIVDEKLASRIIKMYDDLFPRVRLFWNKLFKPFMRFKPGDDVRIRLPFIGEFLRFKHCYWDSEGSVIYNRQGSKDNIYASALCGLVIQSLTSRLFHSVERKLYKRLGVVADIPIHDEFLCSVKEKEVSFDDFKKTIQESPVWLPKEHYPIIQGSAWKGKNW